MADNNYREPSTRKRGRPINKLSVRLFLLDPDNHITKVTKETCSKEGIKGLMEKGYGPPQSEHCLRDDKVEFLLELTNEQFKQKLVEIYPKLENACFVLMRADKNNKLEELNPGRCCFRCYTPENVYNSERGQGRLYIRKIAENEISPCTHGIPRSKRLCSMVGGSLQLYVPILPKPVPAPVATSVAMPTNRELPTLQTESSQSGNMLVNGLRPPVNGSGNYGHQLTEGPLPASTMVSPTISIPPLQSSGNMVVQSQLPTSILSQTQSRQPVHSSVNMVTQRLLPSSAVVSQTESSHSVRSSGNMALQNQLPALSISSGKGLRPPVNSSVNMVTQNQLPISTSNVAWNTSTSPYQSPVNMVAQGSTYFVAGSASMPSFQIPGNMVAQGQSPMSTSFVADNTSMPSFQSSGNMVTQGQSPMSTSFVAESTSMPSFQIPGNMVAQGQLPMSTSFVAENTSMPSFQSSGNMVRQGQLQTFVQERFSSSTGVPDANLEQPIFGEPSQVTSFSPAPFTTIEQDIGAQLRAIWEARGATSIVNTNGNLNMNMLQATGTGFQMTNEISGLHDPNMASTSMVNSSPTPSSGFPASDSWVQPPALNTLAAVSGIVQREQHVELLTSNTNSSNVQGNLNLPEPNELRIKFLDNVELTEKLEISLAVLNDEALLKKLNESKINIRTVEIQSTCEVHKVLSDCSLPSCLKVLRINDNNLNYQDIFALVKSLSGVNNLQELDLSRTKFKESSFISFVSVLINCSNLTKLSLTNNGLTKQDVTCLTTALCSIKCLKSLNLSKSNLTDKQANDILQIHGEAKNIVSLDLSQNVLQGNEIIIKICQLQSLEELNLSHNKIRFFPLPNLEEQCDSLPINTKTISLSFNQMTPNDISQFCSLVRSDLLRLILDSNHVGTSVWSLCSLGLRIKHLKVLSLVNTDVCGAVDGLAFLLSLVGELEELNLSSNNLVLKDFQQLQSPLSNLSQLKGLNLSNNPEGISALFQEILPSFKYLEELRLSNIHLNGDDLSKICDSLASLKGLKYLDISMNAIGPVGTRALANILKKLSLLEGLDVSRSYMTGGEISVLCNGLVPLKELKYLNLSGNRIDIDVLDDGLFLPPTLEELIISDVIHGQKLFAKMVPLKNLRKLHLTNLKLRACDLGALTTMLPSFPKLEVLSLAHIVVPDSTCEKIFSAIKLLKFLRKLDLRGVKVRDGKALSGNRIDIEVLDDGLFLPLTLEELIISDVIHGQKLFGKMLPLQNLKKLHLTNLKLRACDLEALATMLSSFLRLEDLSLAHIVVPDSNCEKIFSAIKLLRNIKKINLSGVKLPDGNALADMLSSLLSLEELVLADMNFANMDYEKFFSAIDLLKFLRKLDLRGVKMRDGKALFDMLSSLTLLEEVVFPAVTLVNADCINFSALESLRYLKNLDLCGITGTETCVEEALLEVLPSLQLLEKVVLGKIYSDEKSDKQLFTAVRNLRYLKELDLKQVWIIETYAETLAEPLLEKLVIRVLVCDDDYQSVFAALEKLKYLKELDLVLHNNTVTATEALAEVLPSLQLLEKLVLVFKETNRDQCSGKQLFAALGKLRYLKELSLELDCMTVTDAEVLDESLRSLQLLEKLVLKHIHFDNESVEKQLFPALGKLRYLKELHLMSPCITETGAEALAEVLPSLQLLEKLVLGVIYCDNESVEKQLFPALGKLRYLKELSLKWDCITETDVLAEFLPSLQLLEKLVLGVIYCDNESVEKQLFAALGKLRYLNELALRRINISATGMKALGGLTSLQLLEAVMLEIDLDGKFHKELFAALGKLGYRLKELQLYSQVRIEIDFDAKGLAEMLPSLQLLEKLDLVGIHFKNESDEQLFNAVRSLSCLKELNISLITITQIGAETLADVLPTLHNLKRFDLPEIDIVEDDALSTRLKEKARLVPGLKVYTLCRSPGSSSYMRLQIVT